jgi:hypothetical protein
MLARLHRAGELTAVYVPQPEDEFIKRLHNGNMPQIGKYYLIGFEWLDLPSVV